MRALAAVLLTLVLSSCFNQGECLITNTNIVKVSLRKKIDGSITEINFTSVSVLNDTVLYTNKTGSVLLLPVNPGVTEMSYVFVRGDRSDTLSLGYNNLTIVLAPQCGAFPYQRNLEITRSTFGLDSAVVTNTSLLTDVPENVRIYF